MKLAIAMITADRRQFGKPEYFWDSFDSLSESGFFGEMIAGDGCLIFDAGPGFENAIRIAAHTGYEHVIPGPITAILKPNANRHRAFQWGLSTGADLVLMLEDDAIYCRNWLARVRQWLVEVAPPDGAIYSFCTEYAFTTEPGNLVRQWAPWAPKDYYGGIAHAFRPDFLRCYLHSKEAQAAIVNETSDDIFIGQFAASKGYSIYAHCPNLAQHIGVESTIGNENKRPIFFPGVEYDAMSPSPQITIEVDGPGYRVIKGLAFDKKGML